MHTGPESKRYMAGFQFFGFGLVVITADHVYNRVVGGT